MQRASAVDLSQRAGPGAARVPRRCRVLAGAAAGLLLGMTGAPAFAASFCRDPSVNALVDQAAHDTLDRDRLTALARRFDTAPPECSPTVAYCIGRKIALASVDQANGLLQKMPPDMDGARALLLQGRSRGSPWQVLALLGDIEAALARQNGDPNLYSDAAGDLQKALNDVNETQKALNDPSKSPPCGEFGEVVPDPETLRRLKKRAQEAVLLSPRFDIAKTKQGDCGGIFLEAVKGIDIEPVPVPITFEYNRADFTAEGRKAADSLLQCLREKNLPAIILTGHTDLHGSDSYNMDLSARRLHAVEAFLKQGGYTGSLRLIPRGMREPFQPDDPTQHSAEEIDQMNRRVELREVAP